ncbi:hypothetical protein NX059_010194 [Plenodomus lindquistii]|nr:hypothetical protein NX059_010194 [Plenodomus lindquistii]
MRQLTLRGAPLGTPPSMIKPPHASGGPTGGEEQENVNPAHVELPPTGVVLFGKPFRPIAPPRTVSPTRRPVANTGHTVGVEGGAE